jgi:hypothetical protein
MTNSKKNLKTTTSNRQRELEDRKGTREYQLRVLETEEAEAEIKNYKIPPCVGHDFEED